MGSRSRSARGDADYDASGAAGTLEPVSAPLNVDKEPAEGPQTLWAKLLGRLGAPITASASAGPREVLPPSARRAAMRSIDATEAKWSKAGLVLSAVFAVFLPVYAQTLHSTKDQSSDVKSEAVILCVLVLVLCALGLLGVLRRRRSFLSFSFFLIGFAFTLTFPPLGFALILLGGWLMLRAYRLQKYGTPNAKLAATQAASRPPRRERKAAAVKTASAGRKTPTASKRYTPKTATRKRPTVTSND